jgi:hypothetical protein
MCWASLAGEVSLLFHSHGLINTSLSPEKFSELDFLVLQREWRILLVIESARNTTGFIAFRLEIASAAEGLRTWVLAVLDSFSRGSGR